MIVCAKQWSIAGIGVCVCVAAGCGQVAPDGLPFGDGTRVAESVVDNDTLINGVQLNGTTYNGRVLNGRVLNGVKLSGASLSGETLTSVTLAKSVFTATRSSGATLSGDQIATAEFPAVLDDGTTITVRIDRSTNGPAPNDDMKLYEVSYLTQAGWQPLCGTTATGAIIPAWAIGGRFDEQKGSYTTDATAYQFACRGASVAKCLEVGYRPWQALPSGTGTFQNHFLACTRMLRADYCGNGHPGTQNGTPIDVYDTAGVLAQATTWGVEAEWTPNGAACVTADSAHARFHYYGLKKEGCWDKKRKARCGDFSFGGLLIDRFN